MRTSTSVLPRHIMFLNVLAFLIISILHAEPGQVFTSGEEGAIIVDMSRHWIRLNDPPRDQLQLTAKWFDFASKSEEHIAATWNVVPDTADIADGLFRQTAHTEVGTYTVTVGYDGKSRSVQLYVVPELAEGDSDIDEDGISDSWETANDHDPDDPNDWMADIDNDDLSTMDEYLAGSDPCVGSVDIDGSIASDGTISNVDRLVWSDATAAGSDPVGWVGASRQCVALWDDSFQVWDSWPWTATSFYPWPGTPLTREHGVEMQAGDRLCLSRSGSSIENPLMAGSLYIDFPNSTEPDPVLDFPWWSLSWCAGTLDGDNNSPPIPARTLLPISMHHHWVAGGPPVPRFTLSLSPIYAYWLTDPLFYTGTAYGYASARRQFLHFTYSLYRVEFAAQTDSSNYSKDWYYWIVNFAPETQIVVNGRIAHSPSIPDEYDTTPDPYKSTIKCRWRSKESGKDKFGSWQYTGVTFVNPTTPPAHESEDLPNVNYRYFSMELADSNSRIYELQFYYDIDGGGTKNDDEESLTVFYVLQPSVATMWATGNKANRIYNATKKDDPDVAPARNKLYVVADATDGKTRVSVKIPTLAGSQF